MWNEIKRCVWRFFNPEAERLKRHAESEYRKYLSDCVWDANGERWGRHGEEVLE